MTAKCALAMALLNGDVLTIMNGFKNLGITNVPREVSRAIEQPFGVIVSKTRKEGLSRYKVPCMWFEYRLNPTEYNKPGMDKMREYVKSQIGELPPPKTDKQAKIIKKAEAAIKTDRQERLF